MKENQLKPSLSLGQLAGGVILAVALWLRHDSQTSNLLILQFEGQQAPGTFYISEYSTPPRNASQPLQTREEVSLFTLTSTFNLPLLYSFLMLGNLFIFTTSI